MKIVFLLFAGYIWRDYLKLIAVSHCHFSAFEVNVLILCLQHQVIFLNTVLLVLFQISCFQKQTCMTLVMLLYVARKNFKSHKFLKINDAYETTYRFEKYKCFLWSTIRGSGKEKLRRQTLQMFVNLILCIPNLQNPGSYS